MAIARVGYTVAEFATLTGLDPKAVRARVWRNTLPSTRLGRTILIPASFVDHLAGTCG